MTRGGKDTDTSIRKRELTFVQWLSEKDLDLDLVEKIISLVKMFSRWTRDNHAYHFEVREIEKEELKKYIKEKKSIPMGYLNCLFIPNNLNHL